MRPIPFAEVENRVQTEPGEAMSNMQNSQDKGPELIAESKPFLMNGSMQIRGIRFLGVENWIQIGDREEMNSCKSTPNKESQLTVESKPMLMSRI
jgi:hypothetical protein